MLWETVHAVFLWRYLVRGGFLDKLLNALFLGKVLNKMSEKAKSKGNMMLLLQEVEGGKKKEFWRKWKSIRRECRYKSRSR